VVPQEVYPNAPIVLTACEVRLPPSGLPVLDEHITGLRDRLDDVLPVFRTLSNQQVSVGFGPTGPEPPSVTRQRVLQLTDRAQSLVVQVAPDSLVIKTADYQGWEVFRPVIGQVLRAARDVLAPDGYSRVGLRYIDEIRLPAGGGNVEDWDGYLNPILLAPDKLRAAAEGLASGGWQVVTRFAADDHHDVVVRYGPGDGHAVKPKEPPLPPRIPAPGPFFLFDIDSFWEGDSEIPEFDPDGLGSLCDRLHQPVRALFDNAVTDRLRDEVLRKERA
jgi:uncharacterized protein (TIGR04255 family)